MARRKKNPLASGEVVAFRPVRNVPTDKPPRKGSSYTDTSKNLAAEQAATQAAKGKRRNWERSVAGRERSTGVEQWFQQTQTARAQGIETEYHGPPSPSAQPRVGQIYHMMGWGTPHPAGQEFYQPQLPGTEREDVAPYSERFEDKNHHEQERTRRALAAHGTSIEKMIQDYGNQLDQSYIRAHQYGTHPFSQHFYGDTSPPALEGDPLKPAAVLHSGAAAGNIPLGVHVAMNAFTSPNTKFTAGKGENMYYPNDETARSVVRQVQAGVPAPEVIPGFTERDPEKKNQGYVTNTRKAADALEQHYEGKRPRDWVGRLSTLKSGEVVHVPENKQRTPFGEKTGPYHNEWLPDAQDFFVSDVHSGGGGMLPHLSSEKPVLYHPDGSPQLDKDGKPKRDKSEREKAIEKIPNFHAVSDYASRQAHYMRGITSTRQGQAAQWGEEQIQRGIETEEHRYVEPQARQAAQAPPLFNDRRVKLDPPVLGPAAPSYHEQTLF